MAVGKSDFGQLTSWRHPDRFRRCVERYKGDHKVSDRTCCDQFLAMAYAQITNRESFADLESSSAPGVTNPIKWVLAPASDGTRLPMAIGRAIG